MRSSKVKTPMGEFARIDGKFHINREQIVKTSNGQIIPEDEPLFLLRGRDNLAIPLLQRYLKFCIQDGCTEYQLKGIEAAIQEFQEFKERPNETAGQFTWSLKIWNLVLDFQT